MSQYHWQLQDDYRIQSMSPEEFRPLFEKYSKEFFDDDSQVFRLRDALSEAERERMKTLNLNMGEPFTLRLGVFYRDEFIGWHFGRQDSFMSFYMVNSAILPDHRRKGLYAELLKRVLEVTTELGFQSIWSRHSSSNNAIIIPKLKHGFVITAFEVSDLFGTLIHLCYYPNPIRRKMTDYRVGQIKPDAQIKTLLGI